MPSTPIAIVVNDDPVQLKILCRLLQKEGLETRSFGDAESALTAMSARWEEAQGSPEAVPDLVITDLYMPGLDGWRFCRLLRSPEYSAFNRVPMVVVSATFRGDDAARTAADLGANCFLPSPVDSALFQEQVHALLDGRKTAYAPCALVVEKDPKQAVLLRAAFQSAGYRADLVSAAEEALRAFAARKYDVAVFAPEGPEEGLLDRFHSARPECVCILMISERQPAPVLDWMKRGAAAHIHEPLDPAHLVELCTRARRERDLLNVQDQLVARTLELQQAVDRHRRAEEELMRSEEKYRQIYERAVEGIFQTTPEGRFRHANPAAARILGYESAEEFIRTIDDISTQVYAFPEDRRRLLERLREHTFVKDFEVQCRHRDGSLVWISLHLWLVYDQEGRIQYIEGTCQDITDRKRVEQALRESEEKYRILLEESPDPIFSYAPEGRYLYANRAYAGAVGKPVGEIIGRKFEDIFSREEAEIRTAAIQEVFRTRRVKEMEIHILREGGDRCYDTTLTPILNHSGEPVSAICSSKEITRRKQMEESLRLTNQQLEQAMARANDLAVQAQAATVAKSRFLANMSHEIRTPLNAVLGFAQLLQEDPELTPLQKKRVDMINRNGEHLLSLLNNILELSKLESGRQASRPQAFDVQGLLNSLEFTFRPRAESKGLTFTMEGITELPAQLVTDEFKIRQVLINLLDNALKFTTAGRVCLRASMEIRERKEGSDPHLVCLVEDSGPGIAAEDLEAVFEAFEQALAGRISEQGTGLGLAISRQFARIMGGELTVSSQLGKGSVFRMEVPVRLLEGKTQAARPRSQWSLESDPGRPVMRVLVVDDMQDNRSLMAKMLVRSGFQVCEAENGAQSIERFEQNRPDLIIMDCRLPGMDGAEAIRQIRKMPGGAEVKIIAVSAGSTDDVYRQSVAAGADTFLRKPFPQKELFSQIRHLTGAKLHGPGMADVPHEPRHEPLVTDAGMIGRLPEELRREIREAAIRGRQIYLMGLVPKVGEADEKTGELFRKLVEDYQYDKLMDLFQ